jgi:hypothetical protein
LIDDKDQLVAEKNENMQSHHQMWRELATAIKQKDAHINDLISELWKRSTESVDTIKRHGEQMGVLREDYDRRTDLLELKLQRLEAAHEKKVTDLRSKHGEKLAHLQLKLDHLRREYKIEKRALVEKNRDLQVQLDDAHRQLEEQDEAYFNADDSVPNDLLDPNMFEPSTAPIPNPIVKTPTEHENNDQPHNAENDNAVIAPHSDSDMDETADVSSNGTLSDADSSDDE